MGMGSNKSISAGIVVSCVVLGLALLVVGATAEGENAIAGIGAPASCGVRCRHADDIDACVKRCRSEIEGVEARGQGGGAAGTRLRVMPTERAGREDVEKKKQGRQTKQKDLADSVYSCEPKCVQQFDPSSDSYLGCIFGCDFGFADGVRLQAHDSTRGEEGKKMKQEMDTIHQLSNTRCEEQCSALYDSSSASYSQCMTICSMI